MKPILCFFVMLCLTFSAQAKITAAVNRSVATEGQSIELKVVSDSRKDGAPNFNILSDAFVLGGQSTLQNTSIINGKMQTTYTAGINLIPLKTGDITIPALTWGGDKTLAAQNRNITGEYYGGDTVEFRQSASDTYSGYVWYFIEQNGFFGKELENAKATATLKKVGESEGKETNAKLTYVHTYGELELGVGIGITTTGLAPSITVGASESYWQIEIDVSGIEY